MKGMTEQQIPTEDAMSPKADTKRHSRRKWLNMIGVAFLLFASYHIGWLRAMSYFGATWETPRGTLRTTNVPSQLPSHLLVCGSTLPMQCYDYRCPLGTSLVNPEQYSIPGGGSRQKDCSDGSVATEVLMKQN